MRRALGMVAGVVSLSSAGAPALAAAPQGIVPEGLWVLDTHRSRELQPGAQTLWVVKDDGHVLIWTSALRDDQDRVKIVSYEGVYGGAPVMMTGGPVRTKISSTGPGRLHNEGEKIGLRPYREDCAVQDDGHAFVCDGQVQGPKGPLSWHDHFAFAGPSPGR